MAGKHIQVYLWMISSKPRTKKCRFILFRPRGFQMEMKGPLKAHENTRCHHHQLRKSLCEALLFRLTTQARFTVFSKGEPYSCSRYSSVCHSNCHYNPDRFDMFYLCPVHPPRCFTIANLQKRADLSGRKTLNITPAHPPTCITTLIQAPSMCHIIFKTVNTTRS